MAPTINNRVTGPSPLPPSVQEAMAQPMISHRSPEFRQIFARVSERMQLLFGSAHAPLLFAASGTGGLEAAVANTLAPGDRVLALSAGHYGDLFAAIARRYAGDGVAVERFAPGQPIDPAAVEVRLRRERFRAVLVTHAESSTGVLHPLREIAAAVRGASDALLLVDAVGSLGATAFAFEELGIDVAVAASQKALMAAPGVTMIATSERVRSSGARGRAAGSFYFDFERALAAQADGQTPSTPAVATIRGLDAALAIILAEGLEHVYARHSRMARRCQDGARAAGYELFAAEGARSPALTAIQIGEQPPARVVQERLERDHGVLTTLGLDDWKERVLRIGHMGWAIEKEVRHAVGALAAVAAELAAANSNVDADPGAGAATGGAERSAS